MRFIFGDPESIKLRDKAVKQASKPRKISAEERHEKQIGMMHRTYGVIETEICKHCAHFTRVRPGQNIYLKCRIFGITGGPATDWRASYVACGKFEKDKSL